MHEEGDKVSDCLLVSSSDIAPREGMGTSEPNIVHIPSLPDGFPSLQAVRFALSYAKIAKEDADASLILYRQRLYAPAIYHLGQAVEKDARAVDLLVSALPRAGEEMEPESDESTMMRLPIRLPGILERIPALRDSVEGVLATSELRSLGLAEVFAPVLRRSTIEDDKAVRDLVVRIRGADPAGAWAETLKMDAISPTTRCILEMFRRADLRSKAADALQTFFEVFRPYLEDPDVLEYFLDVHDRALPELLSLEQVTIWHQNATRYPPGIGSGFGGPERYTRNEGLVKLYPTLHHHVTRLSGATLGAAMAAARSHERHGTPEGVGDSFPHR